MTVEQSRIQTSALVRGRQIKDLEVSILIFVIALLWVVNSGPRIFSTKLQHVCGGTYRAVGDWVYCFKIHSSQPDKIKSGWVSCFGRSIVSFQHFLKFYFIFIACLLSCLKITGGSSGIGKALAEEAFRAGAKVTLLARDLVRHLLPH